MPVFPSYPPLHASYWKRGCLASPTTHLTYHHVSLVHKSAKEAVKLSCYKPFLFFLSLLQTNIVEKETSQFCPLQSTLKNHVCIMCALNSGTHDLGANGSGCLVELDTWDVLCLHQVTVNASDF